MNEKPNPYAAPASSGRNLGGKEILLRGLAGVCLMLCAGCVMLIDVARDVRWQGWRGGPQLLGMVTAAVALAILAAWLLDKSHELTRRKSAAPAE